MVCRAMPIDWQQHAEAFCQSLGVRLHSESVVINEAGAGLESAARDARYQVFEKLVKDGCAAFGSPCR